MFDYELMLYLYIYINLSITCCVKFLNKSHVLATLLDEDCHDVLFDGHRGQPLLGAFPGLAEPPVRPGGGPRDLPLDPKTPPQRSFPELLSAQLFFGPLTLPRGLNNK